MAPNGDIYVAEGHSSAPGSAARVFRFSKDGKLIKSWGTFGNGPDDFDQPHALAMDSKGRLFVGDRGNNRIKIFDQDGKLLDTWYQFSRPSGIFIDRDDNIYVADSESQSVGSGHGREWKRGIRIGSAKDGSVKYFIPDPTENAHEHELGRRRRGGRERRDLRGRSRAEGAEEVREADRVRGAVYGVRRNTHRERQSPRHLAGGFRRSGACCYWCGPPRGSVSAIRPDGPPVPDAKTMYCLPWCRNVIGTAVFTAGICTAPTCLPVALSNA